MSIISSRKKGSRFYWAELGFIALGFLGLNPSLFTDILFGSTATLVQQSIPAAYNNNLYYNANASATNPYASSYYSAYPPANGSSYQPQPTTAHANDVASRLGSFVSNAANHLQDYWANPVGVSNVPIDHIPSTANRSASGVYQQSYAPVANNAYNQAYYGNSNQNYYPNSQPTSSAYGYNQPATPSSYYPASQPYYPNQYPSANTTLGAGQASYPAIAQNGFGNTVPPASYSTPFTNNAPYTSSPYSAQLPGVTANYGPSYPGYYPNGSNTAAWNSAAMQPNTSLNSAYVPAGSTASALGLAPTLANPQSAAVNARNYLAPQPSTNWPAYPTNSPAGIGRY